MSTSPYRMRALRIHPSHTPRADHVLGRYLLELGRHPLLPPAAEEQLAHRAAAGDPLARAQLVRANLRFVVSVAKQYQHRGLPLTDLIAEGNLCMLKAAERFDPTRGFKFISYAAWWIRQRILQALCDQGATVRLPRKQQRLAQRADHAQQAAQMQQGMPLSVQAQAQTLGVRMSTLQHVLQAPRQRDTALTHPADGSDGLEHLPDTESPAPDAHAEHASLRVLLSDLLDRLGTAHCKVLRLHYGIGGAEPLTLRAVGERMGLSAERVRQVRNEALTHLRDRSMLRHEHPTHR